MERRATLPVSAVMVVVAAEGVSEAEDVEAEAVVGVDEEEVGAEVAGAVCDHATLYACHTPSACCPSLFFLH